MPACASAAEGFGLPILEASACGRPVVTFKVGCVPDLIETGARIFVVDSWPMMRAVLMEVDVEYLCQIGAHNAEVVRDRWTWEAHR